MRTLFSFVIASLVVAAGCRTPGTSPIVGPGLDRGPTDTLRASAWELVHPVSNHHYLLLTSVVVKSSDTFAGLLVNRKTRQGNFLHIEFVGGHYYVVTPYDWDLNGKTGLYPSTDGPIAHLKFRSGAGGATKYLEIIPIHRKDVTALPGRLEFRQEMRGDTRFRLDAQDGFFERSNLYVQSKADVFRKVRNVGTISAELKYVVRAAGGSRNPHPVVSSKKYFNLVLADAAGDFFMALETNANASNQVLLAPLALAFFQVGYSRLLGRHLDEDALAIIQHSSPTLGGHRPLFYLLRP